MQDRETARKLEQALRMLRNECHAIMAMSYDAIKESAGYTNLKVWIARVEEADALLASPLSAPPQEDMKLLSDLRAAYAEDYRTACEECGNVAMCRFHTLLSQLFKGTPIAPPQEPTPSDVSARVCGMSLNAGPTPKRRAVEPTGASPQASNLHAQIMNLPYPEPLTDTERRFYQGYKLGFRDARHAAAELVAGLPAPVSPVEPTPEPPNRLASKVDAFMESALKLDRLSKVEPTPEPETCEWREAEAGYHATSCGADAEQPLARLSFCPYCGKPLRLEEPK